MPQEYEFTITFDDFDVSLLPADARTPGSDRFIAEIRRLVEAEFADRGGWARIVVDGGAALLRVTWGDRAEGCDALETALGRLARGELDEAIRTLELLRFRRPDDAAVLYNLGMALSDRGNLPAAVRHLRRAAELAPRDANVLVALGVALTRSGQNAQAIRMLQRAVKVAPTNPWAHRNLGGCLIRDGQAAEAENHFRAAVDLAPEDAAARLGLGQSLVVLSRLDEADEQLAVAVAKAGHGAVADAAKAERTRIAELNFHKAGSGGERSDAVAYCLAALEKFDGMSPADVQKIGFEIAVLGTRGLDPNDPAKRHTLRSMPGEYGGLQLLCTMYAAFQIISPGTDIGFDVSREYAAARQIFGARRGWSGGDGMSR